TGKAAKWTTPAPGCWQTTATAAFESAVKQGGPGRPALFTVFIQLVCRCMSETCPSAMVYLPRRARNAAFGKGVVQDEKVSFCCLRGSAGCCCVFPLFIGNGGAAGTGEQFLRSNLF